MSDELAIGVDIGATKIAYLLMSRQGAIVAEDHEPTNSVEGSEAVLGQVAAGIDRLLGEAKLIVTGIAIGCPGVVGPVSGVVHDAGNLKWRNVALRAEIQKRLARQDFPIWVQNDVNAAAIGEMVFGAARGCRDFVYIAIGTGLGAGAMVGGRLLEGAYSRAMEVGHLPLDSQGRQCVCGQRGCPEMYVSGVGLQAGFREHRSAYPGSTLARLDRPSSRDILAAARSKDPLALALMDEASDRLSTALITCMRLLDPELIVIGGGVGLAAYDLLHDDLIRKVHSRATSATQQVASVVRSQIENSAVGAACLVWYCQEHNA